MTRYRQFVLVYYVAFLRKRNTVALKSLRPPT